MTRLDVDSRIMRRTLLVSAAILATACGGSTPTSPSPTPNPQPTTVTISGRLVATTTAEPVAGASLNFPGRIVTTNADGQWSIDAQTRSATVPVEISAAGFLTRQTAVRTDNGRADIALDAIRDAAPFSLDLFRQIGRGNRDQPGQLQPLVRWSSNPSIYVDTRIGATGAVLSAAEVEAIRSNAAYAIDAVSGGKLHLDKFESGAESRAATAGWIAVNIVRDLTGAYCGTAVVGGNVLTLNHGRCVPECAGIGVLASTIRHEVGHTMGLWHHGTPGLMGSPEPISPCGNPAAFTSAELHHARILYARSNGNLDIDRDGPGTASLAPKAIRAPVYCLR